MLKQFGDSEVQKVNFIVNETPNSQPEVDSDTDSNFMPTSDSNSNYPFLTTDQILSALNYHNMNQHFLLLLLKILTVVMRSHQSNHRMVRKFQVHLLCKHTKNLEPSEDLIECTHKLNYNRLGGHEHFILIKVSLFEGNQVGINV